MAYNRITTMDITEILRRIKQGQSISSISKLLGYDRKTIRKYLQAISENPVDDPSDIIRKISQPEVMGRPQEKQDLLTPLKNEIKELMTNPANKLKAKSAFEVICQRHNLSGSLSYSSFKRFIKRHRIRKSDRNESTCRIDYEPGSEVQIDYCKAGLIYAPEIQKKRTVYAFIGTLSYSRHKYAEFVYTQNQKSFVQSHVNMFRFFRGMPVSVKLDNLKSGIIKPDLYDPRINRSYSELSEHYGFFIDPCRVASPQDKGIVERDVQTIREEFRKMLAVNPLITLSEANARIKDWIINTYGRRKHGTTQLEPYKVFTETEQPELLSLPADEFEIPEWKTAIVHPDHYIQVNKKAYSMPEEYIGEEVLVKVNEKTISVYFKNELIKQHSVPLGFRQTDITDFPDEMRHRLDTGMPLYLRKQASQLCPELERLITRLLRPNAYLNLRRAQAILNIAKQYPVKTIVASSLTAIDSYSNIHPKLFRSIIEKQLEFQMETTNEEIARSLETESFVRDPNYFTH